jgi:hypothetical protein
VTTVRSGDDDVTTTAHHTNVDVHMRSCVWHFDVADSVRGICLGDAVGHCCSLCGSGNPCTCRVNFASHLRIAVCVDTITSRVAVVHIISTSIVFHMSVMFRFTVITNVTTFLLFLLLLFLLLLTILLLLLLLLAVGILLLFLISPIPHVDVIGCA